MSSDETNYQQNIISSSADAQVNASSFANTKPTELTPFSSPNFKFKSLSSFHKHYSSSNLNDETLFNVKSLPSTFHNKSKNGLPSLPTTEWSKFLKFILLERLKAPSEPPSMVKELTAQLSKEPVLNLQELLPLLSQLFDNSPSEAWLNQNFVIFTILVKNSPTYQQTLVVRLDILNIILPFLRDAKEDNIGEIINFLNVFTNQGRNVNGIEVYLFNWLFSYLEFCYQKGENLTNQSVKHILKFYGQLIKFNFSLFSPQELTKLIKLIELMTNWEELDNEGGTLLINIFDTLVRFGYLPTECISSFCSLMAHLYGINQWKLSAWGIVKNILRSHCATSVICNFFDMAYSKDQNLQIVKYSIAAIGESLWGKDRIEPQAYPTFSALKHFSKLLLDSKSLPNSHVRIATILEQLNKLVNTRKANLSPGDWELIIDMLCRASYSINELNIAELKPSLLGIESDLKFEEDSITELWVRFNQLATTISPTLTSLHVNEIQKFIFVLKDHWDCLSEPLLLTSLGYLSSSNVFLPSRTNWNESLKDLLNKLFVTKSQLAKEAMLEILERSFISCSFSNQQTFIDIFKAEILDKLVELEEIDKSVNLKIYKLIVKFWDLNLDDFNPLFELLSKPFKSTEGIDTVKQEELINHQLYSCFILAHWFSLALIGRSKYCTKLYTILCDIASNTHIRYEPRLMAYTSLFNVFTDNSNSHYFGQLSLNEDEVSQCLDLIQDCSKLPNSELSKYWVFNGLYALNIWNNEENYTISTAVESKFANNCTPNTVKYPPSPIDLASTGDFTLSTKTFLQNIINSLTEELDWSIMAYILYQTPAYLTNHLDHIKHNDSILTLRSRLCNLISSGRFGTKLVGIPNYIKKGSLYSSIYRLLDSIIPYKQLFNKSEKDEIVSSYHLGLSRWSNTSIQCIHSLTLCCVEYPMSLTRLLPQIILKLSQIMSTSTISIHILEFLSLLVTLPDLYSNFVEDNFKRVLGISIQYIQYHMGNSNNQQNTQINQVYLQYVLNMAYQVISIWLTRIRASDQAKYVPFLVRGLLLANKGRSSLDEQTITCLDMISRYSFCDSDSVLPSWDLVKDKLFTNDAMLGQSSYWIFGDTIIQINLSKTGFGEVKIRSSSALTTLVKRIEDYAADLPKPSDSEETEQDESTLKIKINEANYLDVHQSMLKDTIAEYKGPGELMPSKTDISPLPRPKLHQIVQPDEGILRGISVLDRMPTVDFHKIGVVYAGPGQTHEKDILANSIGSSNYQKILHNLGNLVRLKQLKGTYTGGLDTEMDLDGKYAYSWTDGLTQLIFHAATLMPTRLKYDPQCNAKKRHIGNDYVSIVYNDSGRDYKFDTLPGQFNLVNIIITPLFEESNQTNQTSPDVDNSSSEQFTPNSNEIFRVETQFRSDINHLSPLVNAKVVTGPSVAPLIRQVALNCSIFTQIYLKPNNYSTNWTERYRQIGRVKERVGNLPMSPTSQ